MSWKGLGCLLLLVLGFVSGETDGEVEGVLVESAASGKMQGLSLVVR